MSELIVTNSEDSLKDEGSRLKELIIALQSPFFLYGISMLAGVLFFQSCSVTESKPPRFEKLPPDSTGITFVNELQDTEDFNILNYLYFYDGGGVAAGDINNDGWVDLYFTANDKPDRLYLNEGDFKFSDITRKAGIWTDDGGWSTGVSMADINGDGYLDIYVCRVNYLSKSGSNQLFINNGDGTFTEKAKEYGLDFRGYSTQAAFFDYDVDGDLDMFLLNHTMHSANSYGNADKLRAQKHPKAGDRLFRNDENNFTDVTSEAGIYSSHLGYGLGVAVSDINMDGWPDIYIGNDFHENDYLYINQRNGQFREALEASIAHTSRSSMGNDVADINNDGLPDILSLDMLPPVLKHLKQAGGADIKIVSETKAGYGFKPQFAHNTLQLHRGFTQNRTPLFSDIAFTAGVAATDWSWAGLISDLDNDGLNDIWITNGIYRRPNDLDFVSKYQNVQEHSRETRVTSEEIELIKEMPHSKISNVLFHNSGNLTFENKTEEWGLFHPGYSNGSAYADLNNDGGLDIVVNNTNQTASLYRNSLPDSMDHYLKIRLHSSGLNSYGLGSKIFVYNNGQTYYREQFPVRGFQSSVDPTIHFGLGATRKIDSIRVIWPDQRTTLLTDIHTNQTLTLHKEEAASEDDISKWVTSNSLLMPIEELWEKSGPSRHPTFDDIDREPLMPYSKARLGPAMASGDIDGDGLDDFYAGGLSGTSGRIYRQKKDGTFTAISNPVFKIHGDHADTDALFFDANGDDHPDLYVVSGGNQYRLSDPRLQDRLYINDGKGHFKYAENNLPIMSSSGSAVTAEDIDKDGDMDLFIGSYVIPNNYGDTPGSYLLINNGEGYFEDHTDEMAPELKYAGMISDAKWADLSGNNLPELILAGEWMPVTVFVFDGKQYINETAKYGLDESGGLWQSLLISDLNSDGRKDIIAGNFGTNSRIQASKSYPLRLYRIFIRESGSTIPVIAAYKNGRWFPLEPLDELAHVLPQLKRKFKSYQAYSKAVMSDIFTPEQLENAAIKEIQTVHSTLFIQLENRQFESRKLPTLAQITPIFALLTGNYGLHSEKQLILGGNLNAVKPSYGGKQDAGLSLILPWSDKQNSFVTGVHSAPLLKRGKRGEIRNIISLQSLNNVEKILISRHRQPPLIYSVNNP